MFVLKEDKSILKVVEIRSFCLGHLAENLLNPRYREKDLYPKENIKTFYLYHTTVKTKFMYGITFYCYTVKCIYIHTVVHYVSLG